MDKTQAQSHRLSLLVLTAGVAAAFWPLGPWYVSRVLDKSDEPWGACALLTVFALLLNDHFSGAKDARSPAETTFHPTRDSLYISLGMLCLVLYVVTFFAAANLAQGVLAMLALWFLVVARLPGAPHAGIAGLLLLALPVIPSLNFFAGYPLRLIVAKGACLLLNCQGFHATQDATTILVNNKLIAVDAPCSGISMLWAEAYMVMLFSCLFKLSLKKTMLLSFLGFILILMSNTIRATALTVTAAVPWDKLTGLNLPLEGDGFVHNGVGVITFCLAAAATMFGALKLSAQGKASARADVNSLPSELHREAVYACQTESAPAVWQGLGRLTIGAVCLCLVACVLPLLNIKQAGYLAGSNGVSASSFEPKWPAQINGNPVVAVESTKEEKAFAAEFPGAMRRFTDGTRAYFVRVINRETRQLHPSSDCFRGLGYSIEPKPLMVCADGTRWSCFEATSASAGPDAGVRLRVLERIYDDHGKSWTDVSQWYWNACFGQSKGPWWDVTIAEPLPETVSKE